MIRTMFVALAASVAVLGVAGAASAEHGGGTTADRGSAAETGRGSWVPSVDFDLRVRGDEFHLGAEVSGFRRLYGAWLSGARRPGGLTLRGRVLDGDRAREFRLDAEVDDWFPRRIGGERI